MTGEDRFHELLAVQARSFDLGSGWVQCVVLLGLRPYSHGLYPKTGLVSQINSARSSIPLSLFHITVLRDTF